MSGVWSWSCQAAAWRRELEVIDTPGTDAQGLCGHEAITLYRCLPIADIIVFMTNIQRRIQESEARLLRNVIDHDQ